MNEYELTVLIHPDLEANLDSALDKVRGLITANGGEITKEDNWGKKKLAYTIKREDFAVYVCFEVKLPAPALLKISNTLNLIQANQVNKPNCRKVKEGIEYGTKYQSSDFVG